MQCRPMYFDGDSSTSSHLPRVLACLVPNDLLAPAGSAAGHRRQSTMTSENPPIPPPLARSPFFVQRRPEDSTGVLLAPAMSYHIPPTLSSGAGQKITCSCLPFSSVDFPSRVVLDLSCTRPGTMRSTPRRHYLPFAVILGSNILLYLRFISKISPRKVRSDTYHIRMS